MGNGLLVKESDTEDFLDTEEYSKIEIPVEYGHRVGRVYTISRKKNLTNGFLENYADELRRLINIRKYIDSKHKLYDVGPTIAVANLIESGEYARFIQQYDSSLTGLEHVIQVEENGHSHHLMPECEDSQFCMQEQRGLIMASMDYRIFESFIANRNDSPQMDIRQELITWPHKNDNAKIFREEILPKAKVNKLEGYETIYQNCVIYQDLVKKMCERYNLSAQDLAKCRALLAQLRQVHRSFRDFPQLVPAA